MSQSPINESTLLAALQQASRSADLIGMSMIEIQEALSVGPDKARRLVRKAIKDGVVTPTRAYRPTMVGVLQLIWVYIPTAKKGKTKRS